MRNKAFLGQMQLYVSLQATKIKPHGKTGKKKKKNKHDFLKTLLKHNKMIPVYFEA